ncbi:PCRF domain-containing protein [Escherichia coli]
MFSGQHDGSDCYIDIQSGSGGTEAQDWATWGRACTCAGRCPRLQARAHRVLRGRRGRHRSATIKFTGEYAFGWLRTETGVHRLVRKSPFDSGGRRHTSFCSVFVYPRNR